MTTNRMELSTRAHDRRTAVSRRLFLRRAGLSAAALAAALLRPDPAHAKAKKAAVKYQDTPRGEKTCAGCRHFIADENACKLVEGEISPQGYCLLWAKKPS